MESRCPRCREHLTVSKGGGPREIRCFLDLKDSPEKSCGHFNPIPGKDEVVDLLKQILEVQIETNRILNFICGPLN